MIVFRQEALNQIFRAHNALLCNLFADDLMTTSWNSILYFLVFFSKPDVKNEPEIWVTVVLKTRKRP